MAAQSPHAYQVSSGANPGATAGAGNPIGGPSNVGADASSTLRLSAPDLLGQTPLGKPMQGGTGEGSGGVTFGSVGASTGVNRDEASSMGSGGNEGPLNEHANVQQQQPQHPHPQLAMVWDQQSHVPDPLSSSTWGATSAVPAAVPTSDQPSVWQQAQPQPQHHLQHQPTGQLVSPHQHNSSVLAGREGRSPAPAWGSQQQQQQVGLNFAAPAARSNLLLFTLFFMRGADARECRIVRTNLGAEEPHPASFCMISGFNWKHRTSCVRFAP